jgi:hypothetical protein
LPGSKFLGLGLIQALTQLGDAALCGPMQKQGTGDGFSSANKYVAGSATRKGWLD